jgi:preprotein translocase SecF subunit
MKTWNIKFYDRRKTYFAVSIALVVIMLVGLVVKGLDLDIQFKGGALLTYSYVGDIDSDDFAAVANQTIGREVSLQDSTDIATGKQNFVISLPTSDGLDPATQSELTAALETAFPDAELELASSSIVDPSLGSEFFAKSLVAVAFAAILMVVYVGLRFRRISGWSAGITAVIALLHDLMVVLAVFVWGGFSINTNFIAVCLTILGYSLNDTIVIYDRIRENKRILGTTVPIEELVTRSVNQSFTRSLMTSVTTCSAMLVVSIVAYLYNVTSIISFSVPMLFGMISGFYSSTCIAPMLWTVWQKKKA